MRAADRESVGLAFANRMFHNSPTPGIHLLDQPYFHKQKYHWSIPSKQGLCLKVRLGAKRDRLEYFGVFWCLLVPCYESTFGVFQPHPFSPRTVFYRPQCIYMVCSYSLVWFVVFNYFWGALLRQLKTGSFYVFSINNRVFVVLFRFLSLFKFAFCTAMAKKKIKTFQGSLISDLFQRLCVYMDCCYILVLFWNFMYFGCTPFETFKNRPF